MEERQIGVVLAGAGAVGSALLHVVERSFASLRVVAIGDSWGFVVSRAGLSWPHIHEILQHKASGNAITSWNPVNKSADIERIEAFLSLVEDLAHAESKAFGNYVVVDCTSSQATAPALIRAKQCGFGVVTANKLPLSLSTEVYNNLVFDADGTRSPLVQYEAAVGAGLPVISALKRIVASRDRIISVQGSFSGTIGYALAEMNGYFMGYCIAVDSFPSTDRVVGCGCDAQDGGPGARDGFETEITSVEIEKLFPDAFLTLPVPLFLAEIPELDPALCTHINSSTLALIALSCMNSSGTENAMEVLTQWFPEPLVLRGTGAGVHSTAAALAADRRPRACQRSVRAPLETRSHMPHGCSVMHS
ncbi:Homoserine dehydrogenase, partial [Globisporangium splendens]